MKLKMTPDEAREILRTFARPHFTNVDNFTAVVRTDPDWVREVLPSPLEPTNPIVTVSFSQSDQFRGLVVGVQCAYQDVQGEFSLAQVMDTDLAVIFGRESTGEPKKLGDARVVETDGHAVGTLRRFDQELIRIEADHAGPGDPSSVSDLNCFQVKYTIRADGSGLDDVQLVCSAFTVTCSSVETYTPRSVVFTPSVNDIYGEIPVIEPLACVRAQVDMICNGRCLTEIDAEAFLPHAFFKHDDYRLTMPVA